MPARLIIHGQASNSIPSTPTHLMRDQGSFRVRTFTLEPPRRGQEVQGLEEAASPDTVIELELEDGTRLWMSLEDYRRDFGGASRGDDDAIRIDASPAFRGGSRGIGQWIVKGLRLIDCDLVEGAAVKAAAKVDTHGQPGLWSMPLDQAGLSLVPASFPGNDLPLLLFIHGTASSTEGAFRGLWLPDQKRARQALAEHYPGRCLAYNHKTFGEGPIQNALALARQLPKGARLHLVSHSRGGLVGELLCRAGRVDAEGKPVEPFDDLDYTALGGQGLEAQREALRQLGAELAAKRFRIERFVRVACPARGTTLASGRLDRMLSVLSRGLALAKQDWLDDLAWFATSVIKERTDPRVIPGLQAQMPDSGLVKLLNRQDVRLDADLTVISGDFQANTWLKRIGDWASEWFYGGQNDVVVNTPSMYGGSPRTGKASYYLETRPGVWHCNYFETTETNDQLVIGLTGDKLSQGGFKPLEDAPGHRQPIARGGVPVDGMPWDRPPLLQRKPDRNGTKPLLLLVPGIMGSQLDIGRFRVWVDVPALALGRFTEFSLDNDAGNVTATQLLEHAYGGLAEYLADSHEVLPFPYDWRRSLAHEGQRLANYLLQEVIPAAQAQRRPVRLLAHSMGGMLVRAAIGLSAQPGNPAAGWWQQANELPGCRFIMSGTPNQGSWLIPYVLSGREDLVSALAGVDLRHRLPEILRTLATFDGFLEMVPRETGHDYFERGTWETLKNMDRDGPDWTVPAAARLARCRAVRNMLDTVAFDPANMIYVAGHWPQTPTAPDWAQPAGLEFGITDKGDHRVPWSLGVPADCQPYYIEARHGDMLSTRKAFPGLRELLDLGRTNLLPTEPRPLAETGFLPRGLPFLPDEAMLARAGMGGELWDPGTETRRQLPRLKVQVCHGDLGAARNPVVVGHYRGDSILSAEAILDKKLDGLLSRALRLGAYPGELGTEDVFWQDAKRIGVVIGLGDVGTLRGAGLRGAFTRGLVKLALQKHGKEAVTEHRVSTLLIGSLAGGIGVGECVQALIEATQHANALLAERDGATSRISELEVLEVYEDRALQALRAVREVATRAGSDELEVACDLRSGQGGCSRASFEPDAGWWRRIRIESTPDQALKFTLLTDLARAEETILPTQRALVDRFIEESIDNPEIRPKEMHALFELLVPRGLKAHSQERGDIQLVLDEASAAYPWEMMFSQDGDQPEGELRPMVLQAGLLRQFATNHYRQDFTRSRAHRALVVGVADPGGRFPALPGVSTEAARAADTLEGEGRFQVSRSIGETPSQIVTRLYDGEYRILHFAGHGVYCHPVKPASRPSCHGQATTEKPCPPGSGMVLDAGTPADPTGPVLLTAAEINQMRRVPELVFINCCHLGAIEARGRQNLSSHNTLAANLAAQFIRIGVRAVVAAGWAVDDQAASAFADTFYSAMIRGNSFGDAVREARRKAYGLNANSTTWAAYQCYGDPSYRFGEGEEIRAPEVFLTASEALHAVRAILAGLSGSDLAARRGNLELKLDALAAGLRHDWLTRGDLRAALGAAYGALGRFKEAIEHYTAARGCPDGGCTLWNLDQLANLQARQAENLSQNPANAEAALAILADVIPAVEARINACGSTTERRSIQASAYKLKLMVLAQQAQPDEADLLITLRKSAEYYEEAAALERDPYPALNAIAYRILEGWHSGWKDIIKDKLREEIQAVRREGEARYKADPTFWNGVYGIDAQVYEQLLNEVAPGKSVADRLLKQYKALHGTHGTDRELDSVTKQFRFLDSQLPAGDAFSAQRLFLQSLVKGLRP